MSEATTNRGRQWVEFSALVLAHIEDYTVPQYGDAPNDLAGHYSPDDCIAQIKKYITRFANPQRGTGERLRDMLKIAHYACLAYRKLAGFKDS